MTTPKTRSPLPGGRNIGCDTCAFRAASVTRQEPYNAMKATLCDLGGVPFYCHHDKDGNDFHAATDKPPMSQLRICQGWAAQMRERAADPAWRKDRSLRKAFAQMALGALELLVDNDSKEDRARHLRTIRTAIEMLVLKRPRKMKFNIPPGATVLHILASGGPDD
jgi:hypothetical protein